MYDDLCEVRLYSVASIRDFGRIVTYVHNKYERQCDGDWQYIFLRCKSRLAGRRMPPLRKTKAR